MLVLGSMLLLVFILARGWGGYQAYAGIKAFEEARAVAGQGSETLAQSRGFSDFQPAGMESPQPDQSLWSEKRIDEYRESLLAGTQPPLGVLSIETVSIEVPVYNGADEANLNRGVARILGTAKIDAAGNLGIAGHRDGFFRGLKDIQTGSTLELRTFEGITRYRVSSIQVVDPGNVSVLADTASRTITLVTCFPFYYVGHAPKRFIVKAEAQSFRSNHRGENT